MQLIAYVRELFLQDILHTHGLPVRSIKHSEFPLQMHSLTHMAVRVGHSLYKQLILSSQGRAQFI